MKTILLRQYRTPVTVDFENKTCDYNYPEIRDIDNLVYVNEDSHVKYTTKDDEVFETDVKKGDVVLTFYNSDFPHKYIVINSPEWTENIIAYKKAEQARKEKWAKEKGGVPEAEPCETAGDCEAA